MQLALEQAELCLKTDDVPVGAVIVKNDHVIGLGRNQREELHLTTAHAEIQAIHAAARTLGSWNLSDSTLYVTLEPCPMCAGAIVQARIKHLVYSATDPKGGAISLSIDILQNSKLNHRVSYQQGDHVERSSELLKEFFQKLRQKKPRDFDSGR